VVLFLTLAAAAYAGLEAHRLAIDTETAIQDARKSASDNADQTATLYAAWGQFAAAMNRQATSTGKLVDQARTSAGYAQQSANAATGQLKEMHAGQRPMVGIIGVDVIAPLKFENGTVTLRVNIGVENGGHSVAQYVDTEGAFYLVQEWPNSRGINPDPLNTEHRACEKLRRRQFGSRKTQGFQLFPTKNMPLGRWWTMGTISTAKWMAGFNKNPPETPYLVGCVGYFFERQPHVTGFVYEVDRKDAASPSRIAVLDPTKGDIQAGDVVLSIPPWYTPETD
jgi:hypothetical protein